MRVLNGGDGRLCGGLGARDGEAAGDVGLVARFRSSLIIRSAAPVEKTAPVRLRSSTSSLGAGRLCFGGALSGATGVVGGSRRPEDIATRDGGGAGSAHLSRDGEQPDPQPTHDC